MGVTVFLTYASRGTNKQAIPVPLPRSYAVIISLVNVFGHRHAAESTQRSDRLPTRFNTDCNTGMFRSVDDVLKRRKILFQTAEPRSLFEAGPPLCRLSSGSNVNIAFRSAEIGLRHITTA